MTVIYVDGDACPVREEIYRVAARLRLNVLVVSNGSRPIRPPGTSNVNMVIVGDSADAAITYRVWAAQLGIKLDKVEIGIDRDIDLRGFFGIDDRIRAGFNAVRINVSLSGPEHATRYEELAAAVDAHCPVLDLFRNPVPVERKLVSAS